MVALPEYAERGPVCAPRLIVSRPARVAEIALFLAARRRPVLDGYFSPAADAVKIAFRGFVEVMDRAAAEVRLQPAPARRARRKNRK